MQRQGIECGPPSKDPQATWLRRHDGADAAQTRHWRHSAELEHRPRPTRRVEQSHVTECHSTRGSTTPAKHRHVGVAEEDGGVS